MLHLKNSIRILTRKIFPKKRVLRIVKLRKEASLRDYYRVFLSGNQSCVVMVLNGETQFSEFVERLQEVNTVFATFRIPIPKIYRYFEEDKVIILKDVGPVSLEAYFVRYGYKKALIFYKQVMDALLRLRHQSVPMELRCKKPYQTKFTQEKFKEEFSFFMQHSGFMQNDTQGKALFLNVFDTLSRKLCEQDFCVTHRDLHSRNLHVSGSEMFFLDHQDARLGPTQYDLVSLIKDSYVDLSHKHEVELISYYMEQSKTAWGVPLDFDTFFYGYYLCLFQRSLKAAGTFFYQVREKENMKYRKYIPRVLKYARSASERIGLEPEVVQALENGLKNTLQSL